MKIKIFPFPIFLVILVMLTGASYGKPTTSPTNVNHCGTLTTSETWSTGNNVHIITCDIVIPVGMTLTIEAGAIVKFKVSSRLIIQGALVARGTANNQIVFTSLNDDEYGGDTDGDGTATPPAKYDWGWIEFADASDDSASFLEYCLIRYGGAYDSYGRHYGGAIKLNNASPTVQNCSFQSNYINGIEIPAGTKQASATQNTETWQNIDVVYVVTGNLVIAKGMKLAIKPGITVKLLVNTRLIIQGALEARGTAIQMINFTSFNDDEHGGDTDADGTNTPPQPNDWGWVEFNDSSDDNASVVDYAHILYGGAYDSYGRHYGGAITLLSAAPTITNSIFERNSNYAIGADAGAFPTIYGNTMVNNGINGIGLYGGNISTDNAFWSTTDSVYILDGTITVAAGKTLTISPGAIVKAKASARLIINGALNANGTTDKKIIFTSMNDDTYGGDTDNDSSATPPAIYDWGWIEFADSSDDSLSSLANCVVRYGGAYDSYGRHYGGAIMLNNAEPTIAGCAFQYNYINGIEIPGGTKNATALKNVERWRNKDVVYTVADNLTIAEGMKLVIEPGVMVKFKASVRMLIQGGFDAQGTSTNRITFTSFNDDDVGGDTDGDGSNTPPKANDWGWIEFENTSDDNANYLGYCTMRYGGAYDSYGRHYGGVITLYSAAPHIANCALLDNYRGIDARGGSTPALGCNDIYRNTDFGISNDTPTTSLIAENQWWGEFSGPTHASNPGGKGQPVSNGVDFTPWATYSCLGPPPPSPVITQVQPNQGYADQPNQITISGSNFVSGAKAKLGDTSLVTTFVISTQLQAIIPSGLAPGGYTLSVINPNGDSATFANAYTVIAPPMPTITEIQPNQGPTDAAANITIYGSNFAVGILVNLGAKPLVSTVINASQLQAIVPAELAPGVYSISVINTDGRGASLANAYTVRQPSNIKPQIQQIRPNQGSADVPNDINIYGVNFANGAIASLGSTALATTFVNATQLQATVPAGLTPGVYDLTVVNPDSGRATLAHAYTVFDPASNDDLFGLDYELWTDPVTLHANGAAKVGLTVHRVGGKQPLSNVTVRFYLGDPNAGGVPLGDGAIPLLSPRDAQNASVAWTPPAAKDYTLYAVIDPANVVAETYEDNNVVHRTVTVLGQAPDQISPHVDSFTINSGALTTADRAVKLNTTASDPQPSSGVKALLFVEYEYSQAASQWVPAQTSGWKDYRTAQANFDWQLLPTTGMKYLQAWAADGAGNVSLFPFKAYINYLPTTYRVGKNQGQVYRYKLNAGQQLAVRLEPISGDPDLYIWAPDYVTRPPWVSNLTNSTDDVTIIAPVEGIYQIEVYGFSAAEYRLLINTGADVAVAQVSGGQDPSKPIPSQPLVAPNSEPNTQIGLPAPGQAQQSIFLPVIRR